MALFEINTTDFDSKSYNILWIINFLRFYGFILSASMFGSLIKAQNMEAVKEGEIFANKRMKVVASLKEQKMMLNSK